MVDLTNAEGQTGRAGRAGHAPAALAAIALVYLVCTAFWPILGFEFVDFDVNDQLVNNPRVHGLSLENVKHILTSKCVSSYYPVRTLTLALDYQIWGMRPLGFKLTGGLIHTVNVLLVFWLILRLFRHPTLPIGPSSPWREAGMAALFAGIMAVHPVVVEPVTWVGGREELLMAMGALGCFHFHLSATRVFESRGGKGLAALYHLGSALCCALACLSNAVGAVIPLIITAWDVLMLPGPKFRRTLRGTAALWAIGALTILVKQLGYSGDTIAPLAPVWTLEWLMLILRTYWMNLTTLVCPTRLGVLYEWVRPQSLLEVEVIGGGVAVGLTCLGLWKLRRQKLILFGLFWFGVALAPTSQVLLHHIARADRFLYLPLAGLVTAGALAVGRLPSGRLATAGSAVAGLSVLLTLNVLTSAQVQTWRNSVTMWKRCVAVAPGNPMAHGCLADSLARDGRFEEAIPHFEESLRLDPNSIDSLNNYAIHLATSEEESLRDYDLAVRYSERGCELSHWEDWQLRRTLSKARSNYAKVFHERGEYRRAIQHCRKAMEADPGYDAPALNLAVILATCPDEDLRRPEEALRLAEKAVMRAESPDAMKLRILAICHAAAGRIDNAISVTERAILAAEDAGHAELVAGLRNELKNYRHRMATGDQSRTVIGPNSEE